MNRSHDELNDSLDDLIGRVGDAVRTEPLPRAPADFVPDRMFEEGCPKCRGTGNTRWGKCFMCKGAGKRTFKTSPEARAKQRQYAAQSQVNKVQSYKDAFKAAHPEIWAWLNANCDKIPFANKMLEAIAKWGGLTEGQLGGCQKWLDAAKAREVARAEATLAAPSVDTAGIDRLKAAFDTALAKAAAEGLKMYPKITIVDLTISPAGATSKNPGALYVKARASREYLGKIVGGKFLPSSACSPDQRDQVLAFVKDPKAAAEAYGQTTGVCCICNATLRSKWKYHGIGPVCAEKFGW